MRTLTRFLAGLQRAQRATAESIGVFLRDTGQGLLEVSHNSLALLGLAWLMFGRTRRKEAEQFTRSVIAIVLKAEASMLQIIGPSRH